MRDVAPNMTDYLETRASFRLEVPESYNYARDVVDAWAGREPGKLALLAVGPDGGGVRRFSFADLARSSDRAARACGPRWCSPTTGGSLGAAGCPGPTAWPRRGRARRTPS
jgi:hypothetical protein